MKYIPLDEVEVYQKAMEIGEEIWNMVDSWNYFAKDTVGKQICRSADSIAANFSEGYGRFSFNERRHYCYISRGSLLETKTWLQKALNRKLVDEALYTRMLDNLKSCHLLLNKYIRSIPKK